MKPLGPGALLLLLALLALPAAAARPTFLDVLAGPATGPDGKAAAPADGLAVEAADNKVTLKFPGFKAGAPVAYDPKVKQYIPVEYRLYRSRSRDLGYLFLAFQPVNPKGWYEFVDREAKNGEKSFYSVRAVDADKVERELYAKVEAVPVDTVPPKRVPPPELEVRDNAVLVRWIPSTEPDFRLYRVYRADGVNGEPRVVAEIGQPENSTFLDPQVKTAAGYVYTITVVDRAGNESVASNDRMAIGRDLTPPDGPATLVAVPNDKTVLLRFNVSQAKDTEFYRVYMADGRLDRKTPFTVVGRIQQREGAFVEEKIKALANGKPYHFYVTAVDQVGNESSPTPIVTAVPIDHTAPPVPGRIEILPMNGALKISFDDVEDLDQDLLGYRIYRRSSAFPQWLLHKVITPAVKRRRVVRDGRPLGIFEPTAIEFRDQGLMNGLRYAYRVTTVDRSGNESEPTGTIDGIPEDRMPPAEIAGLKARAGIAKVTVTFAKRDDRDLIGYVIYRREAGEAGDAGESPKDDGFATAAVLPGAPAKSGKVTWIDFAAVPGVEYEYAVAARDESGNLSKPCAPVKAKPRFDLRLSVSKAYVKNVPHAFVYAYDPNDRSFYVAKTQNYKDYGKFEGPYTLAEAPRNFSPAACLSFQRLEAGAAVFCYNPETLDVYMTSSPDLKNWGAWQLLCDDLPLPPGWSPTTAVAFEQYPDRIEGLAYSPEANSAQRCFTRDSKEWHAWRPVAGTVAPPANFSPENYYGISSDDKGVTLYSFSRSDLALYVSFCFDQRAFRGWYRFEAKAIRPPNRVREDPKP